MIIRGEVTLDQCALIAAGMDIELYGNCTEDILRDGRIKLSFTLRPLTGKDTYRKKSLGYGFGNERRIWAVDWHGHYVFMRAVFEIDPKARITSAMADYHGRDDFLHSAPDTASIAEGSQMFPEYPSEKSVSNADVWVDELDMRALELV